jgi:hypothetical protein
MDGFSGEMEPVRNVVRHASGLKKMASIRTGFIRLISSEIGLEVATRMDRELAIRVFVLLSALLATRTETVSKAEGLQLRRRRVFFIKSSAQPLD